MNDPIICFAVGLSRTDIQAGSTAFSAAAPETALAVTPVTADLLGETVGDVIEQTTKVPRGVGKNTPSPEGNGTIAPGGGYRMVLIHSEDKQQVMQILRSFKQVLPDPKDVIFAVITETALTWTFENYLRHLAREHEYMKTHSPENDPDMKRM